jgi:uncharacterized protein
MTSWLILVVGGLISGILAGLLGIGGGVLLVPLMVAVGFSSVQAVATSTLAILMSSVSGSWQNWRMGYLDLSKAIALGLPAIITAQLGVLIAKLVPQYMLLAGFGTLLLFNIYLFKLRQQLAESESTHSGTHPDREAFPQEMESRPSQQINPSLARALTGGCAGFLAGAFGVGGGVIMVPFQMLLLGEPIKVAIQTSLGVVTITAMSACIGHAIGNNVMWLAGLCMGLAGLVGAQIGTRFLPKIPSTIVSMAFQTLLTILGIYVFWQSWQKFPN